MFVLRLRLAGNLRQNHGASFNLKLVYTEAKDIIHIKVMMMMMMITTIVIIIIIMK